MKEKVFTVERNRNSHIIIPKFILKNFDNENGSLYQMDVYDMRINLGHSKTINTRKGYYTDSTEEYLNASYEKPFADQIKRIICWDFSNLYPITEEFIITAKRFICSLFFRDPQMFDNIQSKSTIFQFCHVKKEDRADLPVLAMSQEDYTFVFDKYMLVFAQTEGTSSFVLPLSGLYNATFFNSSAMIMPVAPHFALVLIDKDAEKHIVTNESVRVLRIPDYNVARLNVLALYHQRRTNHKKALGYSWVVAQDRETLEKLSKDYSIHFPE